MDKVEIIKNGIKKKVQAKDVKDYVASGWAIYKESSNPFDYPKREKLNANKSRTK